MYNPGLTDRRSFGGGSRCFGLDADVHLASRPKGQLAQLLREGFPVALGGGFDLLQLFGTKPGGNDFGTQTRSRCIGWRRWRNPGSTHSKVRSKRAGIHALHASRSILGEMGEKVRYARPGERNSTETLGTEVDFEQVLYRLARHAQSLFTAAACLERAQVVLPGGDCAADLANATLVHAKYPLGKHTVDVGGKRV